MTAGENDPLEPSGIAQFVEHDRCRRYLKQRVDPGEEADARDWREAFGLMNVALFGKGTEFEAEQVTRLAADAERIIAPELDDRTKAGVPDIAVDETWGDSARVRTKQLTAAVERAATLDTTTDDTPYLFLYQVPLGGTLGEEPVYGDADCLALAPADAVTTTATDDTETAVVARVIDCKSAQDEQPAHRVQVAAYCGLLERTLAEGPCEVDCRIEASVLTQPDAADASTAHSPFALPTFQRAQWELFVTQQLGTDGPVAEALTDDLQDQPFVLDQKCNNCAYREACATRAVEQSRSPQSLALLGLDTSTQRALREAGLTSLFEVATLSSPHRETAPMDDPPRIDIDADLHRTLEEALPMPVYELIIRAQALFGEIEPNYPEYRTPPAIPGNDWVPLPNDGTAGWSNIPGAAPGELIHVALFVRPDSARNRIGALGASVTADAADDDAHTIGEVTDAVPDDSTQAATVEADLLERFTSQLFEAIEAVATAVGDPEQAVVHCYTYSDHERDVLTEALERHDDLDAARALRGLCSLHEHGHTDIDQSMLTAVQPVLNEHFALQSVSQGLLSVVDQFVPGWTLDSLDPVDARPNDPPLRDIFGEQFLADAVPYLDADPGIRLHQARGPLAEGPAADAVDATDPTAPDGWYRIRKRSGGQFPLEYLWAAVPKQPGDTTPRLHPDVVDEWAVDDEHEPLYRQEISRFYHRTNAGEEAITKADIEHLVARLSDSLQQLIGAIPYKDTYHPKEPLDVTQLDSFSLSATTLPAAARDYLRMEFGAAEEATRDQYRSSLRERARSGRSMPIRCTDYTLADDGTLTITGELAYDELFPDPATARQVTQQARLRGTNGTSGGSWRVLTRLTATTDTGDDGPATVHTPYDATVEDPADTVHSPPVFVEDLDLETGEIVVTALPHRFRRYGSRFRVDHCGWTCPDGSNLADSEMPVADRDGYVAGRQPVWVETDEFFMLDPMVDDFGAPKADRALRENTVEHNAVWQYLQSRRDGGLGRPDATEYTPIVDPAAVERFCTQLATHDACLTPNEAQRQFIEAVDRPLVPLQGPPGTGKTSGATAPALLARASARARRDQPFTGLVIAPSHEAVDAVLDGVVACLDNWRAATETRCDLEVVRVTPTPAPDGPTRVGSDATHVDVTYAAYHTSAGTETLETVGGTMLAEGPSTSQQLIFATPATLYSLLGIVAETQPAIDGTSAPAAMRYEPGLADVVCVDEASMLDLPRLFLATSALSPHGQTLLVGDHRQLATITTVDWASTRRRPLSETGAYRSALEYVQQLVANPDDLLTTPVGPVTDGGHQTVLSQFEFTGDSTGDTQ